MFKQNNSIVLISPNESLIGFLNSYLIKEIIEKNSNSKCFLINDPSFRKNLEDKLKFFDIDFNYISIKKFNDFKNENMFKIKKFKKTLNLGKILRIKNKNLYLEEPYIDFKDRKYLTKELTKKLNFIELSFVKNYDILENINNSTSIGLYINLIDLENNLINKDFILNATKRLNKYLKQPKLYIFSKNINAEEIKSEIDFEILKLDNEYEEFYFYQKCKNKIILNAKNSSNFSIFNSLISSNRNIYFENNNKLICL